MPEIADMREVCQQRRLNAKGKSVWVGHWFNVLVVRWFSIYLTWACVKLGMSANQVTVLMILSGLAGFALLVPHMLWINIVGVCLLLMAEVLDCVDGEVARWRKESSVKGLYLDLIYHVVCNAPVLSIPALHLYVVSGKQVYLVLAFAGYAMNQIKLGLREEYHRVRSEMETRKPQSNRPSQGTGAGSPGVSKKVLRGLKWILHLTVDKYVAIGLVGGAVLCLHGGIELVAVIVAWWFVVWGCVHNIGDVISKYYIIIPDMEHVKRVR